jgi:hypothetical protein
MHTNIFVPLHALSSLDFFLQWHYFLNSNVI